MDTSATWEQCGGAGGAHFIQPDTDTAGHGQRSSIRRKSHRAVALANGSFAQARRRPLGQTPFPVVPVQHDHGGSHAFCGKGRQLTTAERYHHGVCARPGTQRQGDGCEAVRIRPRMLDREPPAELAVAGRDSIGDADIRQGLAVLIFHFHDQGVGKRTTGRALLSVAGDDLQTECSETRPLKQIPQQHRAILRPRGQRGPIRRKHNRTDVAVMTLQRRDLDSRVHVPHLDCVVARPGGQPAAVLRKRQGSDAARMSFEGGDLGFRGQVPYPYRAILRTGGQRSSIR